MNSFAKPRVLVLMATHNGAAFLEEQLRSVLGQRGTEVEVLISDDSSTDRTRDIIGTFVASDTRVRALPTGRFGSAAANFLRLISDADARGFDAVAFCDQDDLWEPWKLQRHAELLFSNDSSDATKPIAAVSSNVLAFDASGHERLIVKDQPQVLCDYAFESGGPGSTFLLRPESFALVQREVRNPASAASDCQSHDWLMYALVRASGGRWFIDRFASVAYRQHSSNELGANEGLVQNWRRFRKIADGSYRRSVEAIVASAIPVADGKHRARLQWLQEQLRQKTVASRIRLALRSKEFRRRRRDRVALATAILLGIW